ncbi:MAG: enoyl-CoA hydratase/isomerase family protein [Deltaproteobacteria bacterium]|jgi:2-(1,2-epoxy-1,2-dihydrophenyl)acetyl-CoA isomerase|nr:enoyl-CoA hydratase/isomerase family protein [Deltaproteobacteria bacterium]
MRRKFDLAGDFDFYTGEIIGNVLLLNLKDKIMFRATNIKAKSVILDYLDQVSRTDAIKVVLIVSFPKKSGREEYFEFYNQVIKAEFDFNLVYKLFHAVDDIILKIKEINQIVIHVESGNVLPLFLNISLACDYRIAADNTVFQNPCLEYGLVPKGGGAFFLSKILGVSKAYKMMLSEEDVRAEEALKLGLVDEVVPLAELKETALKVAGQFARKPVSSLRCCKRLLNYSFKDLREYLEFETEELTKSIGPFGSGLAKEDLRECL